MLYLFTAPWGAVCVCLVGIALASPVAADDSRRSGPSPALRHALHELWKNSPQVASAEASLEAARARSRSAARPVYNPSLALEGENADVDRRTVGLSLPLDMSGKRRARVAQSDAAVQAAEAQLQLQRREVTARWLKAWASATWLTRQTALAQRRVMLMQRFDVLAARRLAVGDIGTSERDLAALGLTDARIRQATLVGLEASALGVLAALGQATYLPDADDALPPPAALFAARAVDDRADLRLAIAEQHRAQAGVVVADRARRSDPTLSFTGGRVRSGTRSDQVIGIAVSLPLPVLNGGQADVAAAEADAAAAGATQRAARMESEATLVQTRLVYEGLRQASEGFREGHVDALEARADLLHRLWQASELDTSDYLVQLNQSLGTAESGLALQAQLWQAWFDYLAAAGRLDDWIDGMTGGITR